MLCPVLNMCPVKGCDGVGHSRDPSKKAHYQYDTCPMWQSWSDNRVSTVEEVDEAEDFEVESVHDFRMLKVLCRPVVCVAAPFGLGWGCGG